MSKQFRQSRRSPASEFKASKPVAILTLNDLIELYLTQYIEDRRNADGKIIHVARNKKGQNEARRTLTRDIKEGLGTIPAEQIKVEDLTVS